MASSTAFLAAALLAMAAAGQHGLVGAQTTAGPDFGCAPPMRLPDSYPIRALLGQGAFDQGTAMSADGSSLALSGVSDPLLAGHVLTFERVNGSWVERGELVFTGSNCSAACERGAALSFSADGSTLLVTSTGEGGPSVGAAFVFSRDPVSRAYAVQAKLSPVGARGANKFGVSAWLNAKGDAFAVGAPEEAQFTGAVYVFKRFRSRWSQVAKLLGSKPGVTLGQSVSMSGDGKVVLAGAPALYSYKGGLHDPGAAFVWARTAGGWPQTGARLDIRDPAASFVGQPVRLSGDGGKLVACGFNACYVFARRPSGAWAHQTAIQPAGSVSMTANGSVLAIGLPSAKVKRVNTGEVLILVEHKGGNYTQLGEPLVPQTQQSASFGFAVAISGDAGVLAGAGPSFNHLTGAVWVYDACRVG